MPLSGHLARPRPVVAAVEREQLGDLLEREARRLGRADEAQPAGLVRAVVADARAPVCCGRGSGSSPRRW